MTRMTSARIAGSAFLLYIGLGLPGGTLIQKAASGEGVAAKLASVALHANDLRAAIVLILFSSFCALVLGVTLYAITQLQLFVCIWTSCGLHLSERLSANMTFQ